MSTASFQEHVDCLKSAHGDVDIAAVHVKARTLRLLVPGWYDMAGVKWLDRVEVMAAIVAGTRTGSRPQRKISDPMGAPRIRPAYPGHVPRQARPSALRTYVGPGNFGIDSPRAPVKEFRDQVGELPLRNQ